MTKTLHAVYAWRISDGETPAQARLKGDRSAFLAMDALIKKDIKEQSLDLVEISGPEIWVEGGHVHYRTKFEVNEATDEDV